MRWSDPVTNLEFACGTAVFWHFLNKVTKSPEPMIRMILPRYFFQQKMLHTQDQPTASSWKIRQVFLSTQLPRFWCQVNRILQEKPSAQFPREAFWDRLMACKSTGSPAIQPAAHLERKNPSIRIPPTRGNDHEFFGGPPDGWGFPGWKKGARMDAQYLF